MTRADLIAALEKAEGPSRELDAEIRKHVPGDYLPAFTASLDAALTLVPEGLAWRVEPATPGYTDWGKYRAGVTTWEKPYDLPSYGATPAIALCIAALKARE